MSDPGIELGDGGLSLSKGTARPTHPSAKRLGLGLGVSAGCESMLHRQTASGRLAHRLVGDAVGGIQCRVLPSRSGSTAVLQAGPACEHPALSAPRLTQKHKGAWTARVP